MPLAQARRRTGQRITHQRFDPGSDCGYARLLPRPLGVSMLTADERIAVISPGNRQLATREGVRVGDTIADLRAAYGSRLRVRPNLYQPRWRDHFVRNGRRKPKLYVNGRGRVGQIAAGRMPEVDSVEGGA